MAIIGVILFIAGAIVVAALYAVGFAVLGVAWLVLCAFLLSYLNKNDTKNG